MLLFRGVGAGGGLALCVLQLPEFITNASADRDDLTGTLEAGEIGPVAPCKWATEPFACAERGVVHDVDQALIVGRTHLVAGEVCEISAGGEDGGDAWNRGD